MISMFRRLAAAVLALVGIGLSSAVHAQGNQPPAASATLFQNVRIFDGKGASLSAPSDVLVKGNIIERISTAPIAAEPGVSVIAGNGRTLMPGLIDAHWHAMLIRPNPVQAIAGDAGYNNIAAGVEATDTLMRGFTTVRDVGGPVFGLKSAVDSGIRQEFQGHNERRQGLQEHARWLISASIRSDACSKTTASARRRIVRLIK
jgi:hypothetical protein